MAGATSSSDAANASFQGAEGALEPATGSSGAATDTSSTAEEDSNAELLESIQLAEAALEEVRAGRRLARDGLSVEVGRDSSGRMEDVEFRLQKDDWLLISRFFEEQLGPQALGLVKSMTH